MLTVAQEYELPRVRVDLKSLHAHNDRRLDIYKCININFVKDDKKIDSRISKFLGLNCSLDIQSIFYCSLRHSINILGIFHDEPSEMINPPKVLPAQSYCYTLVFPKKRSVYYWP